jgi:ectoine hydroxylase-related dioxygenase (phytanoyl-CoA dioxygenase family)
MASRFCVLKEGAEKTTQPAAWIPFLDVNKNNGCMQVVPEVISQREY